uniref:Uncharacterized protein n=1 Tax=Oryza glaberrima TaxID=4538 RepID=I1R5V9_ORYGL
MSGVPPAAAGGDGTGGAPPGAGAGGGAPGAGAANNNISGGNSASQSSGGPFSGYILLLFPLLALSLYCHVRYVPVPDLHDASSMLLSYCNVPVPDIHDAHRKENGAFNTRKRRAFSAASLYVRPCSGMLRPPLSSELGGGGSEEEEGEPRGERE